MNRVGRIRGVCIVVAAVFCAASMQAGETVHHAGVVDHVTYLASPELKGRKPGSRGSKKARRYIVEQFARAGLVPWGAAEEFIQPILLGKNVVGVLPGSDPDLKDEIVLVSAHYDHLGKKHLGAADNAAGVAALLEVAARLAESPPKRTVAFACFDREETLLWGSINFSVREDFDPAAVVANINLDMLGRKGFGTLENTLFLSYSHTIPAANAALSDTPMNVLPVTSLASSLRSDHAVFEALHIPVLFFTCGPYPDYHQKTDTLERLDLDLLARSANVVGEVVEAVANTPSLQAAPLPLTGTDAMLASAGIVMEAILRDTATFELTPEKRAACEQFRAGLGTHVEAGTCDEAEHADLITQLLLTLAPVITEYEMEHLSDDKGSVTSGEDEEDEKGEEETPYTALQLLAALHGDTLIEGYRGLAMKLRERSRAGMVLRGFPPYEYRRAPILAEEIAVTPHGDDTWTLSTVMPVFEATMRPRLILRFLPAGNGSMSYTLLCARGTRGDLVDNLLIRWERSERYDQTVEAYPKLLQAVTGESPGASYESWSGWRFDQLNVASGAEWKRRVGQSANADVQHQTFLDPYAFYQDVPGAALRIVGDTNAPGHLRNTAIRWAIRLDTETGTAAATTEILATLIPLVGDTTEIEGWSEYLDEQFAWDSLPVIGPVLRQSIPPAKPNEPVRTVGKAVHEHLGFLTGEKDVEATQAAWESWLAQALSRNPDGDFLPEFHELPRGVEFRLRMGEPELSSHGSPLTPPSSPER